MLQPRQQQYQQIAEQPSQKAPLAAGDVQGVIGRIQQDYQQAYFVTGGWLCMLDFALASRGKHAPASSHDMSAKQTYHKPTNTTVLLIPQLSITRRKLLL